MACVQHGKGSVRKLVANENNLFMQKLKVVCAKPCVDQLESLLTQGFDHVDTPNQNVKDARDPNDSGAKWERVEPARLGNREPSADGAGGEGSTRPDSKRSCNIT